MPTICKLCEKKPRRSIRSPICKDCHNAGSRARYHANVEASRKYCREKKARLKPSVDARRHPFSHTYQSMIKRCYKPNAKDYPRYGGRGIQVCDRWLGPVGFENFVEDMGPKPDDTYSLDRYPNRNGNYEPGNCRWATAKEQCLNTRRNRDYRSNIDENSYLFYPQGSLTTLKEFSKLTGIHLEVCKYRYAMNPDADWILSPNFNGTGHEYRGNRYSLVELQLLSSLNYSILSSRINDYGWSVAAAVEAPTTLYTNIKIDDPILDKITTTYKEQLVSLQQLSELEKIPLLALKRRATFGHNIDWLIGDHFPERAYWYKGHKYSRMELSVISNQPAPNIVNRINNLNWSVEKAVDTPPRSTV